MPGSRLRGNEGKRINQSFPSYYFMQHNEAFFDSSVDPLLNQSRTIALAVQENLQSGLEGSQWNDARHITEELEVVGDLRYRSLLPRPMNSAEQFYQPLTICYQQLGCRSEALAVYRRCRSALSIVPAVEPSSVSESIRKSLLS